MKRLSVLFLSLLVLAGLTACDRKTNPRLAGLPDGVQALNIDCFRVRTDSFPECTADIFVYDSDGNGLTGFQAANFAVTEGDNPAVVTRYDNIPAPVYIVMCMDRSGSMSGAPTAAANAAARQFIDAMPADCSLAIIDFGMPVGDPVQISQDFTSDKALLKAKIDAAAVGGNTPLYDAMGLAAQLLNSAPGNRFIFALTDGNNNTSETFTTPEDVIAVTNACEVYADYIVGLGSSIDVFPLDKIARETRGRLYVSPSTAQLDTSFRQALERMTKITRLSFRSRQDNGGRMLNVYLTCGHLTAHGTKSFEH